MDDAAVFVRVPECCERKNHLTLKISLPLCRNGDIFHHPSSTSSLAQTRFVRSNDVAIRFFHALVQHIFRRGALKNC